MKPATLLLLPLVFVLLVSLACGGSSSATPTAKPAADDATTSPGRSLTATLAVTTPDAVETPTFSDAEQAYIGKVLDIIGPIPDAMKKVGELSTSAGENTSLFLDNSWRTSIALQLGILKASAQLVQDLKPPARFQGVQAELVTMGKQLNEGATLYAQGLDEVNPKKITQAAAKFEEGTAAMKRVSQAVVDLKEGKAAAISPAPAEAKGPTAAKAANLRGGPATSFKVVGGVKAGDPLEIVGKNKAGDWYKLATGAWIAGFLVTNPPAVPIVDEPASSAPAPTNVPTASRSGAVAVPLAKGPPTAGDSDCTCDGNTLNCDDFPASGWEAQACYLHCKEVTGGRDVHDLDRDHDGSACEWTY
jgi:hypothetical protein